MPLLIAAKMREPDERDYFDTAVRPLLGNGVEYIGEVGGTEKLDLLSGARALLNPIRWHEPFGMVMIEALACGTPVLAPRRGAAPEIVNHGITGFLCDSKGAFVDALHQLDTLDRRDCRRAVTTHFSTDRMVDEHLDLYEQVAVSRRPRIPPTGPVRHRNRGQPPGRQRREPVPDRRTPRRPPIAAVAQERSTTLAR